METNYSKTEVRNIDEEIKEMFFKEIADQIKYVEKYSDDIERPDKVIESYKKIKKIVDMLFGEYTDEFESIIRKKMDEELSGFQEMRMEIRARGTCKVQFRKLIEERWPHPKVGVELDTVVSRRNLILDILHSPFSLDDILRMIPREKPKPQREKIYIDF